MTTLNVLIVDDEPLAREGVKELLAEVPDVRVVGECEDGTQAIEAIESQSPNLVCLDVQMPGIDGFGVIKEIGAERMPMVIFVTAYDEFAVKAFEVHALDYLLKPIDPDRFVMALERARAGIEHRTFALTTKLMNLLEEMGGPHKYLERISIKNDGKVTFIKTRDVDWIEADGDYMCIYSAGKKQLIRGKIGELESKLNPSAFVRIHRSTIVNIEQIKELQPLFYGEYSLTLHNGKKLTVSRTYREKLQNLLNHSL